MCSKISRGTALQVSGIALIPSDAGKGYGKANRKAAVLLVWASETIISLPLTATEITSQMAASSLCWTHAGFVGTRTVTAGLVFADLVLVGTMLFVWQAARTTLNRSRDGQGAFDDDFA